MPQNRKHVGKVEQATHARTEPNWTTLDQTGVQRPANVLDESFSLPRPARDSMINGVVFFKD